MPASVNKSNYRHYLKSGGIGDYTEFAGRCHFTIGQDGWESVAGYALAWAANRTAPSQVREAVAAR